MAGGQSPRSLRGRAVGHDKQKRPRRSPRRRAVYARDMRRFARRLVKFADTTTVATDADSAAAIAAGANAIVVAAYALMLLLLLSLLLLPQVQQVARDVTQVEGNCLNVRDAMATDSPSLSLFLFFLLPYLELTCNRCARVCVSVT